MLIGSVDIPEELIEAQDSGKLVVFAGAGVSAGRPARLPNFLELARKIGRPVAIRRKQNEPIDLFLGRIQDKGYDVHKQVHQLFNKARSQPNPIHFDILRLLNAAPPVRVVTTNFDNLFNQAAEQVLVEPVSTYRAPALPPGHDFEGIVYLHGCQDQEPNQLVLTDHDFGRAYLADGWAVSFLLQLFRQFTVLFVGYSHDDPPVKYLARGLLKEKTLDRFALVPEGAGEKWRLLGVRPVEYPIQKGPLRYQALETAISKWAGLASMRALDHDKRIEEIVSGVPPPGKSEESDYLLRMLKQPATVHFFVKYAKNPLWLRWVEDQGLLDDLFKITEILDEVGSDFAQWFGDTFIPTHSEKALAVVQRKGPTLNLHFKRALEFSLFKYKRNEGSDPRTIARWILILSGLATRDDLLFSRLIYSLNHPEDDQSALPIFEYLTTPRLKLKPDFPVGLGGEKQEHQVEAEIVLRGDDDDIREFWRLAVKPGLEQHASMLAAMMTRHLIMAYHLMDTWWSRSGYWDLLFWHRSAVEPHEQDQYPEPLDILVYSARDALEWLLEHQPKFGHALIQQWSSYNIPILRRLAISGVRLSNRFTPSEKLVWVLDRDWLFYRGLRHEVFMLLRDAYPDAEEAEQRRLLDRIDQGDSGPWAKDLDEAQREYKKYAILEWLNRVAPGGLLSERLASIQQAHPQFVPSKYPDLDHWVEGGFISPTSPRTAEELATEDPTNDSLISELISFKGEEFTGPSRQGLMSAVSEAVSKHSDWGLRLAQELVRRSEWQADLWLSIIDGWERSDLAEDKWVAVLNVLEGHGNLVVCAWNVAHFLVRGIRKQSGQLPSEGFPVALSLTERLWDQLVSGEDEDDEPAGPERWDWLNNPTGMIAEFWVHCLSDIHAEAGDEWTGMPDQFKWLLGKVIDSNGIDAGHGRAAMAVQLTFLHTIDHQWTKERFLPLFEWGDRLKAEQVWQPFLKFGRKTGAMLPDILPLYDSCFERLDAPELSPVRDRFLNDLASMALYVSPSPILGDRLKKLLRALVPQQKREWASAIGYQVRHMPRPFIGQAWERWLREYWANRINGIPAPLENEEVIKMVEWTVYLGEAFPEAVNLVCQSPLNQFHHSRLFRELKEKELASTYPADLARLLGYVLPRVSEHFGPYCGLLDEIVPVLIDSGEAEVGHLRTIIHSLAELRCPNARALYDQLEDSS